MLSQTISNPISVVSTLDSGKYFLKNDNASLIISSNDLSETLSVIISSFLMKYLQWMKSTFS